MPSAAVMTSGSAASHDFIGVNGCQTYCWSSRRRRAVASLGTPENLCAADRLARSPGRSRARSKRFCELGANRLLRVRLLPDVHWLQTDATVEAVAAHSPSPSRTSVIRRLLASAADGFVLVVLPILWW